MNKRGDLLMHSLLGGDVVLSSGSGNIIVEHDGNRINILQQLETAQKVATQICWSAPNTPLPIWTNRNEMIFPAWGITTLSVGREIYVFGGVNPQNVLLSTSRKFNVDTGNWTLLKPMSTPRSFAFGSVDASGSFIYLFGGYNAATSGDLISSSERYDIEANIWTPVQFNASGVHYKGSSAVIGDQVFFLGGKTKNIPGGNAGVSSYNMRNGAVKTWAPMPYGKYSGSAAAIDNKIYVIGGRDDSDALTQGMFMLDTQTNVWYNRSEYGLPKENMVALSFGGLVILAGGWNSITSVGTSSSVMVLNPRLHAWKNNMVSPLTTSRDSFGMAYVDGKLFAIGGRNLTSALETNTVEIVEPCF